MKYTGDMDKDLKVLVPEIIAYLVAGYDKEMAQYLINRAWYIYRFKPSWGKKIALDNEKARDTLRMFMEHWKEGEEKRRAKSRSARA